MKYKYTTALLCSVTLTQVGAQTLPTRPLLAPMVEVTRPLDRISQPLIKKPLLGPFALSRLPTLEETLTEPLTVLPDKLTLPGIGGVEVVEVKLADGWRAIEREWVMLSDADGIKILKQHAISMTQQKSYPALDLYLVKFVVPESLDSRAALTALLPAEVAISLDRNHVFQNQSEPNNKLLSQTDTQTLSSPMCSQDLSIGMVDTGIQFQHPAFAQSKIISKNLVDIASIAPLNHGTAVASVLVGSGQHFSALVPNATLYAAAVFYKQSEFAQGATMLNVVDGLNWLAEERVQVINMSLAGPDNRILALVIERLIAKGTIIVAAAGNEGPAAPPMYPSAYASVISVSATDDENQIYRWANQGDEIDFVALGVNVYTAHSKGKEARETGTSIASPLVAALAACLSLQHEPQTIQHELIKRSIDLGATGKDPVFGYGLLHRPNN
ncbi:S8 family serine peptidase [Paraglaciecola sp. 25GB23A]|uniref:S8 family serine peptidase n=1 Tax=Paraglaciecola sp. 25GB23A TaxID=3156068 RepID=UPI0032AFD4C3